MSDKTLKLNETGLKNTIVLDYNTCHFFYLHLVQKGIG